MTSEMIEVAQVAKPPDMDRVVVAVDPVVSSSANADECGIVVVGAVTKGAPQDWRAFVLADCTVAGLGPSGWAKAAIAAMEQFGADRLVAEVNQGGQLVAEVIRQIDPLVRPIRRFMRQGGRSRGQSLWRHCTSRAVFHT